MPDIFKKTLQKDEETARRLIQSVGDIPINPFLVALTEAAPSPKNLDEYIKHLGHSNQLARAMRNAVRLKQKYPQAWEMIKKTNLPPSEAMFCFQSIPIQSANEKFRFFSCNKIIFGEEQLTTNHLPLFLCEFYGHKLIAKNQPKVVNTVDGNGQQSILVSPDGLNDDIFLFDNPPPKNENILIEFETKGIKGIWFKIWISQHNTTETFFGNENTGVFTKLAIVYNHPPQSKYPKLFKIARVRQRIDEKTTDYMDFALRLGTNHTQLKGYLSHKDYIGQGKFTRLINETGATIELNFPFIFMYYKDVYYYRPLLNSAELLVKPQEIKTDFFTALQQQIKKTLIFLEGLKQQRIEYIPLRNVSSWLLFETKKNFIENTQGGII